MAVFQYLQGSHWEDEGRLCMVGGQQASVEIKEVLTEHQVLLIHPKDSQAVEHAASEMLCSTHPSRFSCCEWINPEQHVLVS